MGTVISENKVVINTDRAASSESPLYVFAKRTALLATGIAKSTNVTVSNISLEIIREIGIHNSIGIIICFTIVQGYIL